MIDLSAFRFSEQLNRRLRACRLAPTSGIWYWFPMPAGWDLLGFTIDGLLTPESLPDQHAKVFHVQEFEEVIELLANSWRLSGLPLTRDVYRGLPRGRVSRDENAVWHLEHGGEFATRHITRLFGLNGHATRETVIEHETTDPRHVEIVEQTLRYKTNNDPRITRAFDALKNHQPLLSDTVTISPAARASVRLGPHDRPVSR